MQVYDSVLDLIISAFNYFAINKSEQPANKTFNYGKGKIEALAAVIEGTETHTRTASISVNLEKVKSCNFEPGQVPPVLEVPVTQAVIYGWYDNELGSYTNMLGDLTVSVAEGMV